MKKSYIAPLSQSIEMRCDSTLLSLSLGGENNTVSGSDVDNGKIVICSDKKNSWEDVWGTMSDE